MVNQAEKVFDLIITGGQVVSSTSTMREDVAVRGEKIAALLEPGLFLQQASTVIDASGLLVLPGAIDPHTHIYQKSKDYCSQDFEVSTISAAHGGTTTVIDFAFPASGEGMLEAIERRREDADGRVAIDYALHGAISHPSPSALEELPAVIEYGSPSFKGFTIASKHAQTEALDDGFLLAFLRRAKEYGGLLGLHAENGSLVNYTTAKLLSEGKTGVEYYGASRPNISEGEPVRRTINLAREAGAALYIFHLSSKEGMAAVEKARQDGLAVYAETCPHYLFFNDGVYSLPWEKAIQYLRTPPIRSEADRLALWEGAIRGSISCIGTDEVSMQLSYKIEKSRGKPFNELPGGLTQLEMRLPTLYTEGVGKGLISVNRIVDLVSTGPARVFGLYPQKGTIAVGSDADIVLFDPNLRKRITNSDLHTGTDYTVYEGWDLTGYPVTTIARGKVIVDNGQFLGKAGDGKFVRRRIEPRVLGGL